MNDGLSFKRKSPTSSSRIPSRVSNSHGRFLSEHFRLGSKDFLSLFEWSPRLWLHIFIAFVDHEVDECGQSGGVTSHPFWLVPSRTQQRYNYALAYSSKGIL